MSNVNSKTQVYFVDKINNQSSNQPMQQINQAQSTYQPQNIQQPTENFQQQSEIYKQPSEIYKHPTELKQQPSITGGQIQSYNQTQPNNQIQPVIYEDYPDNLEQPQPNLDKPKKRKLKEGEYRWKGVGGFMVLDED